MYVRCIRYLFFFEFFDRHAFTCDGTLVTTVAYTRNKYFISYHLCMFIDLNTRGSSQLIYKDSFTVGDNGIPICKVGFPVKKDSVEKYKLRNKFRCPMFMRIRGCICDTPCTTAIYSRKINLCLMVRFCSEHVHNFYTSESYYINIKRNTNNKRNSK